MDFRSGFDFGHWQVRWHSVVGLDWKAAGRRLVVASLLALDRVWTYHCSCCSE